MTTWTELGPPTDDTTEVRRPTARPTLAELMERAVVVVAIAFPTRPTRSRVEWLVGEFERASLAIDALVESGYLEEVVTDGSEPRLMLGRRRWPVGLPGDSEPKRSTASDSSKSAGRQPPRRRFSSRSPCRASAESAVGCDSAG